MAIIGSGNIARCLTDREGAIFFASGVSNSRCESLSEFARERELIEEVITMNALADKRRTIFYFTSIASSIDSRIKYFMHKVIMENILKQLCSRYVILRIGNLIGDTNPNTFINYIKNRQAQGLSVEIRDEYKYMIDGQTLNMLCQTLPLDQKIELTVATKIAKVKDLLI